jgi:hypothetical protein
MVTVVFAGFLELLRLSIYRQAAPNDGLSMHDIRLIHDFSGSNLDWAGPFQSKRSTAKIQMFSDMKSIMTRKQEYVPDISFSFDVGRSMLNVHSFLSKCLQCRGVLT